LPKDGPLRLQATEKLHQMTSPNDSQLDPDVGTIDRAESSDVPSDIVVREDLRTERQSVGESFHQNQEQESEDSDTPPHEDTLEEQAEQLFRVSYFC
jgi:hypothetical protein